MCQWHHNTCSKELKKKTIRSSDEMSIPSQYPWKRAEKEEKKMQPNLFAIHARCVKGHTVGSQYLWKHSRWNHCHPFWGLDIIIIDNELKRWEWKEKEDNTTGMNSMPSIWKRRWKAHWEWIDWCNHQILKLPWWDGGATTPLHLLWWRKGWHARGHHSVDLTLWCSSRK